MTHEGGLISRGQRHRIDYQGDLNEEQLAAVMHPGGPMLVLAGAGSGKTRTLVYRVCRLIEDGVPPGKILLLTFTNKAAHEMLDRVERLGQAGIGRVMGGTFHSAGHRILRRYAESIGYAPRFSILDREDSVDLMGHALADVQKELDEKRTPKPRLLINLYSMVINTGRELESVVADRAPQFLEQGPLMATVFRRYLERKRDADLMDFDDLLLNWLLLLTRHAGVRQELSGRFDHILVDEYQDTNRLQADIVEKMLGPQRNLMVVGDDAQSIYGFRGADFENILGFPERHEGCTIFRLETNYRSRPEILAVANCSIECNQRQFRKELRAVRATGEKPRSISVPGPEDQARWVADEILRLREAGIDLEEMAVLYRNHAHSIDLQVELTRRNIPFRIRSGLRFFEQRHIKDVLAHLRFVDNPRDEVSFARMMKIRSGFGPRMTSRLWEATGPGDRLQTLLQGSPSVFGLARPATRELETTVDLLRLLETPRLRSQAGEAIRAVVEHFYDGWAKDNLENATSRIEDLHQLALFADAQPDVATFLAEVTMLTDLSGEDQLGGPEDEYLTLSTTHQSKGLEWKAVFVLWVAEGRFPTPRAEDIEEERRLFYVAITRAQDHLALVHPQMARDRYAVDVLIDPSRFLLELPQELFENVVIKPLLPPGDGDVPELESRYDMLAFLLPAEGNDGDVN
jgi:DNA helicase-2/ATP-dependent DNA helicase PcrA